MKVVYTAEHRKHAPRFMLLGMRLLPHPDVPERVDAIAERFRDSDSVRFVEPRAYPPERLADIHDPTYVAFVRAESHRLRGEEASYPFLSPPTGRPRPPAQPGVQRGYYFGDTTTPVTAGTFDAAKAAADGALTAAELLLDGEPRVYALVRPPGHHAGRRRGGGYCYFNNTALAARTLARRGPVAVLDIDFHHGNGTQELFYASDRVLTVSIHGDPKSTYPFYFGFADERGRGRGKRYNLNLPLPRKAPLSQYMDSLQKALGRIRRFAPRFLVIALGFDTYRDDPNGAFDLDTEAYQAVGEAIGALRLPALVVQEGGYNVEAVGLCAANFFRGLRGLLKT